MSLDRRGNIKAAHRNPQRDNDNSSDDASEDYDDDDNIHLVRAKPRTQVPGINQHSKSISKSNKYK